MKRKWFEIFANLLFWLFTIWLITNSFSMEIQEIEVVDGEEVISIKRDETIFLTLLLTTIISVFLFYANFWNTLKLGKGERKEKVILISISLFVITLVLHYVIHTQAFFSQQTFFTPSISWGVFIFYFTISIAYGIAKVWAQAERQKQQLFLEKKEAELSLLRSQLHPHFLFNVLNNLLSMVDQQKNPALANSLDRLSGLLRYVVYDTVKSKVSIRKEIDFVKNFAELQSLRFEQGEIDFVLKLIGNFDQQEIEPGIFIPFVENAFKYGVEPEKASRIEICFDLSDKNKINFSIENPIFPTMQEHKGNGSGIISSKERLNLVYPNRHKLTILENNNFKVKIEINTYESDNR